MHRPSVTSRGLLDAEISAGRRGLLLVTSTAQAAPWRVESYTINPGTFYSAAQYDAAEDYVLVVQCHEESGVFELYVESPYDWETGASYAPEVPAILTVGGVEVSDVMFYFDDRSMIEGIRADNTSEAFGSLLDRMLAAGEHGEIGLTYFDRSTSFSTEGLLDALHTLLGSCL
jgi:hypothetical protein